MNIAVEKDAALSGQLSGNKDPIFAEPEGKKRPAQKRAQGDTGLTRAVGKFIFVTGDGKMEFGRAGVHDHIIICQLTEIDRGLF